MEQTRCAKQSGIPKGLGGVKIDSSRTVSSPAGNHSSFTQPKPCVAVKIPVSQRINDFKGGIETKPLVLLGALPKERLLFTLSHQGNDPVMPHPLVNGDPGPAVNINPLLKQLRPSASQLHVGSGVVDEVAFAISNIFSKTLSNVQTSLLLYTLSLTGLEQDPEILAKCATVMRAAASRVDSEELRNVIKSKSLKCGNYNGGLCDIVGTGGDYHSTFNISTASSILASSLLLTAKHGNRASTSKSGSADVLGCMKVPEPPRLDLVGPKALATIYKRTNFAFLFAPNFHTGLKQVGTIRKEIPCPTIFNLLGPLTNPADELIEAQVIGVKKQDLVPVFAEALRLNGSKKAMVVCGDEDLDEISCAGMSHCARLVDWSNDDNQSDVRIETFAVAPADFGLPEHPLKSVSPGLTPNENAEILKRLLSDRLPEDDPILHFVLMNAASLFVISGICDNDTSAFGDGAPVNTEVGPGGGRWKEGVRLARHAIKHGIALQMLKRFTEATHTLNS